jgi:hypothetical protein
MPKGPRGREASIYPPDTWIEPEEVCYPNGGYHRRARVRCSDGKLRIVRCSLPDTYFTIPARAKVKGKTVTGCVSVQHAEVVCTAFGYRANHHLLP